MGIFDKMKTIFWDSEEEEEDEVVEREKIQPKKKDTTNKQETINERDLFKTDASFKFPVVFTEEDFAKTISPEKTVNEDYKKQPREKTIEEEKQIKKKEAEKTFRVSPAISPIYGVLDKNYKKEEISQPTTTYHDDDEMSFENVRKKAYGTLSDDIEKTLDHSNLREKIKKEKHSEPKEIVNPNKDITMEEAIESFEESGLIYSTDNNTEEDIVKLKKDKKNILEDTIEQDLFNLIDSMYDKENKGDDK